MWKYKEHRWIILIHGMRMHGSGFRTEKHLGPAAKSPEIFLKIPYRFKLKGKLEGWFLHTANQPKSAVTSLVWYGK